MSKKISQIPDFEKALHQLEKLVERMEGGELSLEESLKSFERGIALSRQCQTALEQAQQRVEEVRANEAEQPGPPGGDV